MKILCLYNNEIAIELFEYVSSCGHETVLFTDRLNPLWCQEQSFDLTISYTYRFILTENVIVALNNNVVNIHNSFLPWNRGADPNIWNILENSPRGVTIHYIDEELDHGDIIAQTLLPRVTVCSGESRVNKDAVEQQLTLTTTYDDLDRAAKMLFKTAFEYYPFWDSMRKSTHKEGSYHNSSELSKLKKQLGSYDTSVSETIKKYASLNSSLINII